MNIYRLTFKISLISFCFMLFNILLGTILINKKPYGIIIFIVLLFISFIITLYLLSKVSFYACSICSKKFPMMLSQVMNNNVGHSRKLKCPYCHEESWCTPAPKN